MEEEAAMGGEEVLSEIVDMCIWDNGMAFVLDERSTGSPPLWVMMLPTQGGIIE